jgi:hypothetical protein
MNGGMVVVDIWGGHRWVIPQEYLAPLLSIISKKQVVQLKSYKDEKGNWKERVAIDKNSRNDRTEVQFLTEEEWEAIQAHSRLEGNGDT